MSDKKHIPMRWDLKVGDIVQFTCKEQAHDRGLSYDDVGLITDFIDAENDGMGYYEVQFPNDRTWADAVELHLVSER